MILTLMLAAMLGPLQCADIHTVPGRIVAVRGWEDQHVKLTVRVDGWFRKRSIIKACNTSMDAVEPQATVEVETR